MSNSFVRPLRLFFSIFHEVKASCSKLISGEVSLAVPALSGTPTDLKERNFAFSRD